MGLAERIQKIVQGMPQYSGTFEALVLEVNPIQLQLSDNPKVQPSGTSVLIPGRLTVQTYNVTIGDQTNLVLDNSLKVGDLVFGTFSNYGQRFYIVDRIGG